MGKVRRTFDKYTPKGGELKISVMITTRDRRDDLRRTLTQVTKLNPAPIEVLVCADGCTDDTVNMIESQFPSVDLTVSKTGIGSVPSRDMMMRKAVGDWVLSLDDDSYPRELNFIALVAPIIQSHPDAAVIRFPELRDGSQFAGNDLTPDSAGKYVAAFPNCAALIDRNYYMQLPGFPGFFEHMYEETDYACQCYCEGKGVRFEPSITIRHHMDDSQRQSIRRHHLNARNELWSVWMRCPWPWLPVVSAFRVVRQFRFAWSQGISWAIREPIWWIMALRGIAKCYRSRTPAIWSQYFGWMKLARKPSNTSPR